MYKRQSLGRAGAWNAQAAFGADVLTRIAYVMEHDGGLALLQDVLRRQVLSLVEELCRRHLPPGRRAGELFLSGNTVMQHLSLIHILRVPGAGPAQALPRGQVKELGRDGGGAKVHGGACAGARRKGKRCV